MISAGPSLLAFTSSFHCLRIFPKLENEAILPIDLLSNVSGIGKHDHCGQWIKFLIKLLSLVSLASFRQWKSSHLFLARNVMIKRQWSVGALFVGEFNTWRARRRGWMGPFAVWVSSQGVWHHMSLLLEPAWT